MTTLKSALFSLAFAGLLFAGCEKKSSEGGEQKDSSAAESKSSVSADTVTFKIDTAQSIVKWLGKKVTGEHNGTIKIKEGEVQVAGDRIVGGTVVMDMTSIKNADITDKEMNDKLVGHLKAEDFFNVAKHPTSTFVITGSEGNTIKGNLTVKDKTDTVSTAVEAKVEENTLKTKGKTTIDRTKWDIKYGSKKFFESIGDKAIYDDIDLEFDIVATKK